jgi:hypothetical protein
MHMKVLRRPQLQAFVLVFWAFLGVLADAQAAPPLPPQFSELGHDYPAFGGQPSFAVGDFDDDGRDDFVFAGETGAGFWALFVVGKDADGTMVFKQQTLIPDPQITRVLTVPQPTGAPHVLTIAGDGTAREYTGWPLAETHHFTTLASPSGATAGNIFGDGIPRVAVRSDSQLGVYVVATGAASWVHPSTGSGDLVLAQLDADSELEIVLGGNSAPGLVLDGMTGATDWSYPDAFGTLLASGPLGPNKEIQFVGALNQITVFSGAPYSPIWDYVQGLYFTPTALAVGDLDGDGRAEILFSVQNGPLQVIDTITHMATPLGNLYFTGAITFVDLDGNGQHDILLGDGSSIGVADSQTGASLWQIMSRPADFRATAIADSDGDGSSELLTGYGVSTWSTDSNGLQIRDMDNGNTLAILTSGCCSTYDYFAVASSRILVAPDLPAMAPQIVLAGTTVYDGTVVVVDGKTHAVTTQIGTYGQPPFYSRSISDAALIDVDGDGVPDIVAATQPSLSWVTGAKLQSFTIGGQPIWESVGMGTGTGSYNISTVFALTPDTGAGDVVVAVLDDSLRAFDRLTHLLLWTLSVANNGAVVIPRGATGAEIAVEDGTSVTFYDAPTRGLLRSFTLADAIDAITPLDGRLDRLLVSSGGQLRVIDGTTGTELASSPWLGDEMARGNRLAVETIGAGHWRIGIGGAIGVYRYDLITDDLFGSGFETP